MLINQIRVKPLDFMVSGRCRICVDGTNFVENADLFFSGGEGGMQIFVLIEKNVY